MPFSASTMFTASAFSGKVVFNPGYYYPGMYRDYSSVAPATQQVELSTSFTGSGYVIALSATDVSQYPNFTVTMINNGANNLFSGTIEESPNQVNWIVLSSTFSLLPSGGGMQVATFSNVGYKWIRVRAVASGAAGALTGSTDTFLTMN